MSGMEIFAAEGATAEYVTTDTNDTGTMDSILTVDLPRGTWAKILNSVPRGSQVGVPVYMRLKDSNDDLLPTNTNLRFEVLPAGYEDPLKVSKTVKSISQWNNKTLTEQRNDDNIDSVKIPLQAPENMGGELVEDVDFRDIDQFRVALNSAQQVDHANLEFYIDAAAIRGPNQR